MLRFLSFGFHQMSKVGTTFMAGYLIACSLFISSSCWSFSANFSSMYCLFLGFFFIVFLPPQLCCSCVANHCTCVFQEDLARPGAPGQGPRAAGAPATARPWKKKLHSSVLCFEAWLCGFWLLDAAKPFVFNFLNAFRLRISMLVSCYFLFQFC